MQHKQHVGTADQSSHGAHPQDPEERDAPGAGAAYGGHTQSDLYSGSGRLGGWGDDARVTTTSPNIWSQVAPSPRAEASSSASYGYYGDNSVNSFHRSANDSFENDVVTSMANLSVHQPIGSQQPPSSLASAVSRGQPYVVPHSTSSSLRSGSSTIPGLAGLSSGSTNAGLHQDYDSLNSRRQQQQQPSSLATAASRGPPPGFGSSIQSLKKRDNESSRGSRGNSWSSKSGGHGRARGEKQSDAFYSYSASPVGDSTATSEALKALMNPVSSASISTLEPDAMSWPERPILPEQSLLIPDDVFSDNDSQDEDSSSWDESGILPTTKNSSPVSKKCEWLHRMNRRLAEIPIGELDPASIPISAVMNAWAKTKSPQGAAMVEMWLNRAQQEYDSGNLRVMPTAKLYTMAVDAWAKSGEGGAAATRAEVILQHMNQLYQKGGHDNLKPTTGIFNAVINAWARSRENIAAVRAEQILEWMEKLHLNGNIDVKPDKYTFNTVIHAWAKSGGREAAVKAQHLLNNMRRMHKEGHSMAQPDTITYNVVINAWAKSGSKGAAGEAEKLLSEMHALHKRGDPHIKPNVVTYGAVIDAYAKSGERDAAARADTLLANMIQLHQLDPVRNADLRPNTYVFNTVINCWAKSKEPDAASKAEEMLVAMGRLHSNGIPNLKPDAFTYTAVIDAWAKSGYRGAASRADQLLDKMETKYMAGDTDLKPNTFTYNAVINALAKSGEPGAAARAERVLHNMVNRHRNGNDEVKPTTINFNTVLDAWAKSGGGRSAAERAEEILEWMDRLYKENNKEVRPDTITFNAVLDAWARSGDRMAPRRAEQIVDHMDELFRAGNTTVKPDTYTYNTLINAWAKSGEKGAASRAEHVLSIMERRYRDGDEDFKPNTRTRTSVIDAWAKSGEKGAARRAEQILKSMEANYEASGDPDVRPNVHSANAVCNACAFTKLPEDKAEALEIAFRVFDWLCSQPDLDADAYTYTILLSVCANLLPKEDKVTRYAHARAFFERCCEGGYVNDYVLRKLRQTVTEGDYLTLVEYRGDQSASNMPPSWTRNARVNNNLSQKGSRKGGNWNTRRGRR